MLVSHRRLSLMFSLEAAMHIRYFTAYILLTFSMIIAAHTKGYAFVNDVATITIFSPQSYGDPYRTVYPIGFPIRIEARFKNVGANTQRDVAVGYTISNRAGTILFIDSAIIQGDWGANQLRDLVISEYLPYRLPSTLYVRVFTKLANDEDRSNDSLPREPGPGLPFTTRYLHEVGSMPFDPGVTPATDATYPMGPIPIRIAFVNDGFADATNIPARVSIRQDNPYYGRLIYSRSITIPMLPGGDTAPGTIIFEQFPDFIPPSPGSYWIEASIRSQEDIFYGNDSIRWKFHVSSGSSDVPSTDRSNHSNPESAASGALTVCPNPAHDGAALVDVRLAASTIARLDLHDASGRLMKSLVGEGMVREKSVRLDLSGLASGLYLIRLVTTDGTERTETLVVAR